MRKRNLNFLLLFTFLAFFCLPSHVQGATNVSQNITTNTVWSAKKSPYKVTADIKLQQGATLKIEPGVVVEFYPEKSLEVNGKLQAIGTAAAPILFTAASNRPWDVISFTDFSDDATYSPSGAYADGCILSHCVIEKGGGLFIRFGAPLITRCEVRNNVSSGIRVEFGAPKIIANRIYENSTEPDPASGNGAGIIAYTDKHVLISDNIIYNNISDGGRDGGGGIYAYTADNGKIEIINNVIFGNTSSRFGGGIYAYKTLLKQNTLFNNRSELRGGGIYGVECEIVNNLVQANESQRGGGIFAENSEIKSNSIIRNHATGSEGGAIHYFGSGSVEGNCISGNSASGETACGAIYVSGNPVIRDNDILGNNGYALYIANVADAPDVVASDNYWGTMSERAILDLTYDWMDNDLSGLAIYKPYLKSFAKDTPALPPANVKASSQENGIALQWDESPESNFTGHRVYIGSSSGYPYETVIQTGPEQSYLVTNLEPEREYFISVSGYKDQDDREVETGLSEEVKLVYSPSEPKLKAPQNLSPAGKSSVRGDIVLQASPPEPDADIVLYRWQVCGVGDMLMSPIIDAITSGKTIAAYRPEQLQGGREYFWRVASCSLTGSWSDWSKFAEFSIPAESATLISGPISSTMTFRKAQSPYQIGGNTIIMPGGTLTIEPGTQVKIAPGRNLKVRGLLIARGTTDEPIVFTKSGKENWGNIIFADQSIDAVADQERNYREGNVLEFCRIEKGKGVLIESASPFIKNCEIADNDGSGIVVRQGGPALIGNSIHHNVAPTNGGGVYAYTNDIILVESNKIHDNRADGDGGGIYAYGYMNTSTIHVEDNDIYSNTATGNGGGIYLSRSSAVGNRVSANVAKAGGGGIYTTFGLVDGNKITNNQADQGGGIFTEQNSSITHNFISSNTALAQFGGGVYINFWGVSIENEKFAGNTVTANRCSSKNDNGGVYVIGYLVFEQNNVYDNFGSQLFNGNESNSSPLVATNCYWGTSDDKAIAKQIIDVGDNPSLGKVTFEPFLAEPVKID
jgi:hypothetical protein